MLLLKIFKHPLFPSLPHLYLYIVYFLFRSLSARCLENFSYSQLQLLKETRHITHAHKLVGSITSFQNSILFRDERAREHTHNACLFKVSYVTLNKHKKEQKTRESATSRKTIERKCFYLLMLSFLQGSQYCPLSGYKKHSRYTCLCFTHCN